MNAPAPGTTASSGWITYTKGVAFLAPALFFWCFGLIVLWPKLIEMWPHASSKIPQDQGVMNTLLLLVHCSRPVLGVVIIAFIFLELCFRGWARYRQVVVGLTVFLLNTAVFVGLTAMCLAAIIAYQAIASQTK